MRALVNALMRLSIIGRVRGTALCRPLCCVCPCGQEIISYPFKRTPTVRRKNRGVISKISGRCIGLYFGFKVPTDMKACGYGFLFRTSWLADLYTTEQKCTLEIYVYMWVHLPMQPYCIFKKMSIIFTSHIINQHISSDEAEVELRGKLRGGKNRSSVAWIRMGQ